MNLYELDALIACLDRTEDEELIEFYLKKRVELVKEICKNVMEKL